jgi:hypothetical protein
MIAMLLRRERVPDAETEEWPDIFLPNAGKDWRERNMDNQAIDLIDEFYRSFQSFPSFRAAVVTTLSSITTGMHPPWHRP